MAAKPPFPMLGHLDVCFVIHIKRTPSIVIVTYKHVVGIIVVIINIILYNINNMRYNIYYYTTSY